METRIQKQEGMDVIRQFVEFMAQQSMREQAESFMAVFQSITDMQTQMDGMKQEIKKLENINEELGKLLNERVEHKQYEEVRIFTDNIVNDLSVIPDGLKDAKNCLINTAKQATQAFQEKGRRAMDRVLQKGIFMAKKILVSCKEKMVSSYASYEKVADRIDRTGNELKQIGTDFSNVGRALTGKEKKVTEAPDQGVALTRVINAPVKKHMESLKKQMSKIDQMFERLDKVSEGLTPQKEVTGERSSVVDKLQQMKERAEERRNEQPELQKEKTQEACL